ncbi:MAG: STAS domain-containing protein [Gammaproteobacteria bacterium]|nr:MAG: STAS domain-containing protein [Gammaproteobacteria bacterium]
MPGTKSSKRIPRKKAAQTLVRCGESLDISCARELHQELSKALGKALPVMIDAGRVERVDTAALQLFAAFWLQARLRKLPVQWSNPSEALCRSARLQSLAAGHLRVRLEQRPIPGGRAIKICAEDSGTGFNAQEVVSALGSGNKLYGRGIALARRLTTRLEYAGCGNKVEAEYHG